MTRSTQTKSWRDASPIAADIIAGKHDDEIAYIQQACTARLKQSFRKNARVEVTSGSLMGRTGVVLKMNQKRVSVQIDGEGSWNIPPSMLAVIEPQIAGSGLSGTLTRHPAPGERSETDGLR